MYSRNPNPSTRGVSRTIFRSRGTLSRLNLRNSKVNSLIVRKVIDPLMVTVESVLSLHLGGIEDNFDLRRV